jgi:hypothetical protein
MADLIPPDMHRCQTERPCTWPHMPSFMTLGPVTYSRCNNLPTWIASDGTGEMSLCDECKEVSARVFTGDDALSYRPLPRTEQEEPHG